MWADPFYSSKVMFGSIGPVGSINTYVGLILILQTGIGSGFVYDP
jgi:hypothetical protein